MQRVSVIGSSGAGKTTFARELARRLGAPYNSHGVSDLVWARADTIVWLDSPR